MPKIVPPGGSKICDPDELKYDHLKAAGSVVSLTKFDEGVVKRLRPSTQKFNCLLTIVIKK